MVIDKKEKKNHILEPIDVDASKDKNWKNQEILLIFIYFGVLVKVQGDIFLS